MITQLQKKQGMFYAWFFIGASMLALEAYIDVNTGIENAVTPYQKTVIGIMSFIFAVANGISGVTRSYLIKKGKIAAGYSMTALLVICVVYSSIVIMSFLSTMWQDKARTAVESSVSYQAKKTAINILSNHQERKSFDPALIADLNQKLTDAQAADANCDLLKSDPGTKNKWKKINACHNKYDALIGGYQTQLSQMNDFNSTVRYDLTNGLDSLMKISREAKEDESAIGAFSMPVAKMIANTKEGANSVMLFIGGLITVFAIWLSNYSFYYVGQFIDDEEIKPMFNFSGLANSFRPHSPTPTGTTAFLNTQQSEPENLESVFQRGHTQKLSDDPANEKNNPIGFMNWEKPVAIDKPFKKNTTLENTESRQNTAINTICEAVNQVRKPIVLVKNTVECTPSDTDTNVSKNVSVELSRDSAAFAYDALKTAVLNGNFFQVKSKCTGRAVMPYLRSINIKCSQNTAYDLVDRLKAERIIDENGLKIHS